MQPITRPRVRVTVESPYAGDVDRNAAYLRRALLDSTLNHHEAPTASHALYTQFLDDTDPEQRAIGIECGLLWATKADKMIFYVDYGYSHGMHMAVLFAERNLIPTEERRIGPNP